MRGRRFVLAACAIGIIGSQAGHLLAFQLRFGAAAQQVQSSGIHSYFPLVAKTALGVLAAGLVGALLVIGLARTMSGRAQAKSASTPRYIELVAALFTIQLACFAAQEISEALVAGTAVDSAAHLILWGALGQLPVAAIAAIALRWLATRFESAVGELGAALALLVLPEPRHASRSLAVTLWPAQNGALLLSTVAGRSLGKRGPPSSSRLSS